MPSRNRAVRPGDQQILHAGQGPRAEPARWRTSPAWIGARDAGTPFAPLYCVSLLALPLAALPWLQGFFAPSASSDAGSYDCGSDEPSAMVISADLAPRPGTERITASYSRGIAIVDAEQRPIALAPGFPCEGSADELVAIAAGDGAIGVPLLALAATSGGHNESWTVLRLYRVGAGGTLVQVFAGEVEHDTRDADEGTRTTRTGIVTLLPGGLVYRDPYGVLSLWTYDAQRGQYTEALSARPAT